VQQAIRALGRKAAAIHLDLADAASVAKIGSASRGALGRLDVWINNAGADILTGHNATLDRVEKLDRLIAVDLRGTVLASWQAAEMFAQQDEGADCEIRLLRRELTRALSHHLDSLTVRDLQLVPEVERHGGAVEPGPEIGGCRGRADDHGSLLALPGTGGAGDRVGVGRDQARPRRMQVGGARVLEAVAGDRDDNPLPLDVASEDGGETGGG